MFRDLRVNAQYDWISSLIHVRLLDVSSASGQPMTVGEPVVMAPLKECAHVPPTFTLTSAAAQQLMDQLWQCGLRPTEGTGSAGAMAAVEKHLADMRKIAFNQLEIDG